MQAGPRRLARAPARAAALTDRANDRPRRVEVEWRVHKKQLAEALWVVVKECIHLGTHARGGGAVAMLAAQTPLVVARSTHPPPNPP